MEIDGLVDLLQSFHTEVPRSNPKVRLELQSDSLYSSFSIWDRKFEGLRPPEPKIHRRTPSIQFFQSCNQLSSSDKSSIRIHLPDALYEDVSVCRFGEFLVVQSSDFYSAVPLSGSFSITTWSSASQVLSIGIN
jgi:hypothetical protein